MINIDIIEMNVMGGSLLLGGGELNAELPFWESAPGV